MVRFTVDAVVVFVILIRTIAEHGFALIAVCDALLSAGVDPQKAEKAADEVAHLMKPSLVFMIAAFGVGEVLLRFGIGFFTWGAAGDD